MGNNNKKFLLLFSHYAQQKLLENTKKFKYIDIFISKLHKFYYLEMNFYLACEILDFVFGLEQEML